MFYFLCLFVLLSKLQLSLNLVYSHSITLDFFNLKSHQTWREKKILLKFFLSSAFEFSLTFFFPIWSHMNTTYTKQMRKTSKYFFCIRVRSTWWQLTWCGFYEIRELPMSNACFVVTKKWFKDFVIKIGLLNFHVDFYHRWHYPACKM